MNTYLIPTTAAYCYESYDYIYLIYANTSQIDINIERNKINEQI